MPTLVQKANKKILKGTRRLLEIIPNPELEKLVDDILAITQGFDYPDFPKPTYSKPQYILSPIDVGPYNPPNTMDDFISLSLAIKQVRKGMKNITKGFNLLKEANEGLYTHLELSEPLDLVSEYARALESLLLELRGNGY